LMYLKNFKSPSFAQQISEIFRQNLFIASLWSSPIQYFNVNKIIDSIKEYTDDVNLQESLNVVLKAKDIHLSDEHYIKNLKLNCLREEVLLNPNINTILIEFVKFIYINNFPREIVKYRNDFAHGNFNTKKKQNEYEYAKNISYLVKLLNMVAQLCILNELGFEEDKIIHIYHSDKPKFKPYSMILGI
jgi:hypothetical protein